MSYDAAEATDKDVVRGLIDDIGTPELFADATILSVLARKPTVKRAAAELAKRMEARRLRRPESFTAGTSTISHGRRPTDWAALATSLLAEADDDDAHDGGLFDWAEQVPDVFSARERLRNQALRDAI